MCSLLAACLTAGHRVTCLRAHTAPLRPAAWEVSGVQADRLVLSWVTTVG